MNRIVVAFVVSLSLLSSSASNALGVSNYDGPDAATVSAHMETHGFAKYDGFTFASVDGQRVSGIRAQDQYFSKLRLSPGTHRIGVLYLSPKGLLRQYAVQVLLDVSLKAGGNYQLNGSRTENRLKAWVEEVDTHTIVSRFARNPESAPNKSETSPPTSNDAGVKSEIGAETPQSNSPTPKQ